LLAHARGSELLYPADGSYQIGSRASILLMTKIALAMLLCSGLWARTYEILLPSPTKAGQVLLVPGQYRVTLDGTDAVFQNVRNAQSFRTSVKVEDTGASYDATRISTSRNDGAERLDAMELEGSGTRIEF
jgi:hypothetical protein